MEIEKIIKDDFETVYKTTLIISLIQISAAFILLIFGWFYSAISDNSVSQKAIDFLWVIIIFLVAASFILRRFLFSRHRLIKMSGQNNVLSILQNNTVILILTGLVVAILGFLIGSLSGNKLEIFHAGIIASVVFLFNFPRRAIWQNIVYQLEKV